MSDISLSSQRAGRIRSPFKTVKAPMAVEKAQRGEPTRVLVCGGRNFAEYDWVLRALAIYEGTDTTIVHGGARGADHLAGKAAECWGLKVDVHSADWTQFGRAAGVLRNQAMLESGVDLVIAFPGGTGTADMIRRARKAGVEVKEVGR